jgi:3'(2'), 5'-bisphosphate nucleotidase
MLEAELRAAKEASRLATRRIMELYASFEAIAEPDISISTQADRDSQELILQTLSKAFPEDAFVAEEATPTLERLAHTGRRLWIIDPIDGTRGFAQKNGEFSVMIALAVDGEAVLGVVEEPALGRITWAIKGEGCWREDRTRCRVNDQKRLEEATLVQSRTKPGKGPSPAVRALKPARVDETHSAGVKLARVARGEAGMYVNDYPKFRDWDIAAGHVLVTEASGVVSGLKGEKIVYGLEGNRQEAGLLAATPALHALCLEGLRGAF